MNLQSILLLIVLAVIVAFAIRKIIRDWKSAGCGCGCSYCTGCSHEKEEKENSISK